MDYFSLENYNYQLPKELIAMHPCHPRDHSRLMVVERKTAKMWEMPFYDLASFLEPHDRLVVNDTRVIPARLFGKREGGAVFEVFLLKEKREGTWECWIRPAKRMQEGSRIIFGSGFEGHVVEKTGERIFLIRFDCDGPLSEKLEQYGKMPLPPYIKRGEEERDKEDYQTIFARHPGAVAAPTASLHFTPPLLSQLEEKGIQILPITLHVGAGTFQPIEESDIRQHTMHEESFFVSEETANALHDGLGRVICVGTTCCRAVESSIDTMGLIRQGWGTTNLFIYPGYSFCKTEALLTNFHLPQSSLFILVSAFAGLELIREAYAKAIEDRFRFYSYGDAMLII